MIKNRIQKSNYKNIVLDYEGILYMKMVTIVIYKIIFITITLKEFLD